MKPSGAWIIRLNGAKDDLEDLSSQFTSPEFVVWDESGDYYLTSSEFVPLGEPAKIIEDANEIVAVMRALIEISRGFMPDIGIAGVLREEADRKRTQFIIGQAGGRTNKRGYRRRRDNRWRRRACSAVTFAPIPNVGCLA
jgi:hypothetical protein